MRQDAQGAGWGRWEMGRAGHKDSGDWEGTGICPAPISHILAQAQWRRWQRSCCGPRRLQEQQQANLDTALRQRPGSLVPLPVNTPAPDHSPTRLRSAASHRGRYWATGLAHLVTAWRKVRVKKWLQMLPAL